VTTAFASDIQHSVQSSLVAALARARMDREPFSHVSLEHAFPPDIYRAMLDGLPGLDCFVPDNPSKYGAAARRFHRPAGDTPAPVSCRYTMPLNDANLAGVPEAGRALWTGVASALASDELKDRIFSVFAADLCRRFRTDVPGLSRIPAYPRPTLIRDLSGYWIAPHPDSPAKIVTVQFYLARDLSQRALGTTLYRRRLFNPRILISRSNLFEPVRQMEFLPNTGYAFPVGSRSWHGRAEVPAGSGERNSILLVYYRDPSREW
jgi:hypothetical protein